MKGAMACLAACLTCAIGAFLANNLLVCLGLVASLLAVDMIMSELVQAQRERDEVRRIVERERDR